MSMEPQQIDALGQELYRALRENRTIAPLTERFATITLEDAYAIQTRMNEHRYQDGETVVGKKIGVTSKAVQNRLGVAQPDFGILTSAMVKADGETVNLDELIQPLAEGEIAFILKRDLMGPGVTNADVLRATEAVMPCFEIVDSRIHNWAIKIQDTIADNASCGLFVLGGNWISPRNFDLGTCGMVLYNNGELVGTGAGAASMDSPVNAVVWLANMLGSLGIPLKAGEVILSGSLAQMIPISRGDFMEIIIGGMGSASIRFA